MTIFQHWIPAFAGMTSHPMPFSSQSYRRKPARSAIQSELLLDELSSYLVSRQIHVKTREGFPQHSKKIDFQTSRPEWPGWEAGTDDKE